MLSYPEGTFFLYLGEGAPYKLGTSEKSKWDLEPLEPITLFMCWHDKDNYWEQSTFDQYRVLTPDQALLWMLEA